MSDEQREDTPFNMAMLYYMELHKLRSSVDALYTEQQYSACYRQLRLLYAKISKKLSKEEREDLNKKFNELRDNINVNVGGNVGRQVMSYAIVQADNAIVTIYTDLNNLMFKYRMIFPKITTMGLQDLKKRYGL